MKRLNPLDVIKEERKLVSKEDWKVIQFLKRKDAKIEARKVETKLLKGSKYYEQ